MKCGNDGKCTSFDDEGKSTQCDAGTMACFHGFLSMENGTRYMMKDCLAGGSIPTHLQMVGCVRVKGTGQDDHFCFCDTDNCNAHYCSPDRCDCAYADPDQCFDPVEPGSKLQYWFFFI